MLNTTKKWIVLPSEKAAESKRRHLFSASQESIWLGEHIFSLPHFLRKLTPQLKIINRGAQKHLLYYCLRKTPLKYFEKLRFHPSLTKIFLHAVRQLKKYKIVPAQLEEIFKETGSLKEFDLKIIYQAYENLKEELRVFDMEDLYSKAVQEIEENKINFETLETIQFENFENSFPALDCLIQTLKKRTKIKIEIQKVSQNLKTQSPPHFLSFASPLLETEWFLKELTSWLEQTPLHQIGIFMGNNPSYYESTWNRLQFLGLTAENYPYLKQTEQKFFQTLMHANSQTKLQKAFLKDWIQPLLEKGVEPQVQEGFKEMFFAESLVPLGPLTFREWKLILTEMFEEPHSPSISLQLDGIQWLRLEEEDFPSLEILWVPGLIEGSFPSISISPFFSDPKERNKKEWQVVREAFPDLPTLFQKRKQRFLTQMSLSKSNWLTTPRLGPSGEDFSPSSFTWDFGNPKPSSQSEILFLSKEMENQELQIKNHLRIQIQIERERFTHQLQTGLYHAILETKHLETTPPPLKEGHIFSPSQLESYAACPFKYFSRRVLNIPEEKERDPQVDPEDRGTLFHDCLEKLLKRYQKLFCEARKNLEKQETLFQKLDLIVEEVFQERAPLFAYANKELYLQLKEKVRHQAKKLLQNEFLEASEISAPMDPAYFEWKFGATLQEALQIETSEGDPIYLGGRIDRIDQETNQKRFLILDYKTGKIEKYREKLFEGLSLQLPIYLLAVRTLLLPKFDMMGGLLIQTKTGEKKAGLVDKTFNETHFSIHPRSHALFDTKDFQDWIQKTIERVRFYVLQIRRGYFPPDPKDCQRFCDYKEICRYPLKPI